jgi:uncharacterized protein YbjQ (UPF0145 family)
MSGKADIKVDIGGDAKPLERELSRAKTGVHGFARSVESSSKSMKLMRMPEVNMLKVPESLIAAFSVGGLARMAIGLTEAAAKTRDIATAAKLPLEEYLRLEAAAKASGVPIEKLNAEIKDYSEGRKTLEEVGLAVGIIGMKAGGSSDQIKQLGQDIRDLAEYNDRLSEVKEDASKLGGKAIIGLSNFFQMASRSAIETVAQGRPVSFWEASEMMDVEKSKERAQREAKSARQVRDHDTTVNVKRDLAAFFDNFEQQAKQLQTIRTQSQEKIDKITVNAPKGGDSLAAVAGFMGGKADGSQRMLMERHIKIAEIQAEEAKRTNEILGGS